MPHPELPSLNVQLFLATWLLLYLLFKSVVTWVKVWQGYRSGNALFEWQESPRTNWSHFVESTAVGLTLVWVWLSVVTRFAQTTEVAPKSMTTADLLISLAAESGITFLLPTILLSSLRPATEYGLTFHSLRVQIRDGVNGFFLSVLPMGITMVLTTLASLRSPQTQHPLLKLLQDTGSPFDISLVFLVAAVFAPLCEEMMFRVILQGWLTTMMKPHYAIAIVVVSFAAIHGLADGIALLPLAAILGYVFYRRHSYISVVVIHSLFNGTMLVVQILTLSKKSL